MPVRLKYTCWFRAAVVPRAPAHVCLIMSSLMTGVLIMGMSRICEPSTHVARQVPHMGRPGPTCLKLAHIGRHAAFCLGTSDGGPGVRI